MPLYDVRLEAADGSGHFRNSTIAADSEKEARDTLEAREREYELYRLDTAEIAALEETYGKALIQKALALPKEAKLSEHVDLPSNVRTTLVLHRQPKPYKIVSLKARAETGAEA